jgi:hypothetical protein
MQIFVCITDLFGCPEFFNITKVPRVCQSLLWHLCTPLLCRPHFSGSHVDSISPISSPPTAIGVLAKVVDLDQLSFFSFWSWAQPCWCFHAVGSSCATVVLGHAQSQSHPTASKLPVYILLHVYYIYTVVVVRRKRNNNSREFWHTPVFTWNSLTTSQRGWFYSLFHGRTGCRSLVVVLSLSKR